MASSFDLCYGVLLGCYSVVFLFRSNKISLASSSWPCLRDEHVAAIACNVAFAGAAGAGSKPITLRIPV